MELILDEPKWVQQMNEAKWQHRREGDAQQRNLVKNVKTWALRQTKYTSNLWTEGVN